MDLQEVGTTAEHYSEQTQDRIQWQLGSVEEANELAAAKKWRDIHKIWAEYKGKPRKEVVVNFRLKTGHDCLAAHLSKIGIYEILTQEKNIL
jgi:hypothetical protein